MELNVMFTHDWEDRIPLIHKEGDSYVDCLTIWTHDYPVAYISLTYAPKKLNQLIYLDKCDRTYRF